MDLLRFNSPFWVLFFSSFIVQISWVILLSRGLVDLKLTVFSFGLILIFSSWIAFIITIAFLRKTSFIILAILSFISISITTLFILTMFGSGLFGLGEAGPQNPYSKPRGGSLYLFFPISISIISSMLLEFLYRIKRPS